MAERDISTLLAELDAGDMAGFTRSFVDDLEAAMSMDAGIEADSDWSGVICLGMGGSGAGGRFLKSLADSEGGLPFVVWSDYGLPSWWGPDWLVLATSYSGDTEETLDGVRMALESGGTVIGVSSGGQLSEILEDSDECVLLPVPAGQAPRSAFGHIFGAQLAASWALGLLPSPNTDEISGMLDNIESEVVWRIECEGESQLERLLYAAHVTDWVSIGMALAKGVDPSDMAAIDSLKAHLASIQ